MTKIIAIEPAGVDETNDLEIDHPDHQFYLANGLLTSNSHAHVYSYNSYHCAWLFTYYEREWIKACLERDPDLEKTISAIVKLGYRIGKPDINFSLADQWQIIDRTCLPPFSAIKGIGVTAAEELVQERGERQFASLSDFFWRIDEHGHQQWRWQKFNKKALSALIQCEAFDSLLCIGEDHAFKNYHHMEQVIFRDKNFDIIKKGVVKEGRGKKAVATNLALTALSGIEEQVRDWTNKEKLVMQKELTGTFDKQLLFTPGQKWFIEYNGLCPFTEVQDQETKVCWFFVEKVSGAVTASGKEYCKVQISDGHSASKTLNVFNDVPANIAHKLCAAKLKYAGDWLNVASAILPIPETWNSE